MQGLKIQPVIFTFAFFRIRIVYFTPLTTTLQIMDAVPTWVPVYRQPSLWHPHDC